jgi:hypothetical protein
MFFSMGAPPRPEARLLELGGFAFAIVNLRFQESQRPGLSAVPALRSWLRLQAQTALFPDFLL